MSIEHVRRNILIEEMLFINHDAGHILKFV